MRRSKTVKRHPYGKMQSQEYKVKVVEKPLISNEDFQRIIKNVRNTERLPTIEVVRDEILTAIFYINQIHRHNNSVLKHKDCCFEEYIEYVRRIVKVILSREFIEAHNSLKST